MQIKFVALVMIACLAVPCSAQSDRYELGKRLRRFEVAWQTADTGRREASTQPMQKAVQSFFSLQFAKAASQLDAAYFAVRDPATPSEFEQLAISYGLQVRPVAVERQSGSVNIKLRPFTQPASQAKSDAQADMLEATKVRVELLEGDAAVRGSFVLDWHEAVAGKELTFSDVPEGDYGLQASIELQAEKFLLPTVQLSFVDDLVKRLEKIEGWLKENSPRAISRILKRRIDCRFAVMRKRYARKLNSERSRPTFRQRGCSIWPKI